MWIARHEDKILTLFTFKPFKQNGQWHQTVTSHYAMAIDSKLFPEVKCEDEEPTEIEIVIKGTK